MDFDSYFNAKEIIEFAYSAIDKIVELYQPGRIPCGYLTIRSSKDGRLILYVPIGECPAEKIEAYRRNSMEKSERLVAHPDDLSSWQSRDPAKSQWGGAIRASNYIVSFSGLPEHADEALCAAIANHFGWLDPQHVTAQKIFLASDNTKGQEALLLAA